MVGNVWELTTGCWNGDCSHRVLLGGLWHYPVRFLHPQARNIHSVDSRDVGNGFRVARSID